MDPSLEGGGEQQEQASNPLAETVEEGIQQNQQPERSFLAEAMEGTAGKPGSEKPKEIKPNDSAAAAAAEEDADMDAAWAALEAREAAKAEGAPERKSELLTQYADAVEAERKAIATTPKFSRQVKDATAAREGLEKAIMDENRALGLDLYDGLESWSQRQDILQSRTKENTAQYAAFLGTPFEWLDTHLTYGDKEQGERGKLGDYGARLFENAYNLNQEAQQDFANGTEGISGLAKMGIGLGKTVANTAEDAMASFLVPGLGLKMAAARSAGAGALEQADRENNDIDARMAKLAFNGALTYLTERAIGGAEAAFGKSWLSKELQEAIPKLASPVMKRLFNTEWLEEGVEYGLNYLGDKYFGFDPNAEFSLSEMGQQMAAGYFMGTIFNGIIGGIDYDAQKLRNVADEAARAAQMGLTIDEATSAALAEPDENVKIIAGNQKPDADIEPAAGTDVNAPTQSGVESILSNPQGEDGRLSNSQVRQILEDPDMYQEFLRAAGMEPGDIDHSSKSAERNAIKDAADRIAQQRSNQEVTDIVNEWNEQQGQETPGPTEPNADTRARVRDILNRADAEQRGLAPSEINAILQDPMALKAYADENGTTARQARADLEQLLNGPSRAEMATAESQEQTGVNDSERTPLNRFWNAVNEGPDALLHLIAEDPANMEEYMRIFEAATGEPMSNDPEVLQDQVNRITEEAAERSGRNQSESNANFDEEEYAGEEQGEPRSNQNQTPNERNPRQNSGNQRQNNGTQQTGQNPNPNPNVPGYQDSATTGSGKEQVSQHFTNTLTGREGDDVRSPLTYLKKSDAETLQNALNRLERNGEAETQTLMATTMWTDEQVKMGKAIGQDLLAEARRTGDYAAYDAWRMVENEHARAIARALRAEAESGADQTERARSLSNRYLDLLESANEDPRNSGPKVKQEVIDKARQTVNDVATEIANLEAEEADLVRQGLSADEAFDSVKDGYLDLAQRLVAERNMGLLWDNILGRNKAIRNGNNDVQTRLRKMLAKEDPEYIRQYCRANNSGVATDVLYKSRPTLKQAATMVSSMQSMCMLFGTGTFLRNTESNIVFGGLNAVANNTANLGADLLLSVATGQRTRGLGAGAFSKSGWEAFGRAGRRSILEIAANMDMTEDGKYIGNTQAFSPYNPVTRVFARLNQLLSYSLNTSDAVMLGMTSDTAENAAMRVGQRSGMTEDTAGRIGKQNADYATFKNDTAITKFLEGVQNAMDFIGFGGEIVYFGDSKVPRGRKGGWGAGSLLAKFVKVPANIKSKLIEFSPVGTGIGLYDAVQATKLARNSAPNSQARQDSMVLQNKASGEIGRGVTGTALMFAMAMLIKEAKKNGKEWFRDWDQEKDANIKAQNKAEGKSGQQVNLSALGLVDGNGDWGTSDRTVDISSNEPMNQFLTTAAALADDEDMISIEDFAEAMYTGISENIADMPCVETFSTFQDTLEYSKIYETTYEEDEEGNVVENREVNKGATLANAAGAAVGSAAGGFVPAPARHIAQMQDEYKRDTRGKTASETAWNQVVSNIPTVKIGDRTIIEGRQSLPVKTDAFGNPIKQGDVATRAANTFLANKYSQIEQSPISGEINRLYEETGTSLMPPQNGPKTVTFGSGKNKRTAELSSAESRGFGEAYGSRYDKAGNKLMQNPIYKRSDADTQAAMMKDVQLMSKDVAKGRVAVNHNIDYESRYEDIRKLDNPVGYLATRTGFKIANGDEDFDAIDALIPDVGNMSEKDRDFLRSKNSQLMSYYDYMTPNAHGYKVGSSESVAAMREMEKANAEARGVKQASGADTLKAVEEGYKQDKFTEDDVNAFMTKQASDGDYDLSKGRVAIYLAAIASGKTVDEAFQIINSADRDSNGQIDEKGLYIVPEREGTKALKRAGVNSAGKKAFDEIMYPNGRGKRNGW